MQAYVYQNLSKAGFGFYNNQSQRMITCRDTGCIKAFKRAAGELLLTSYLHEKY
jgi:hypothetical protein